MNGLTGRRMGGDTRTEATLPGAPTTETLAPMRASLYEGLSRGYASLPEDVRTRLGIEQVDFGAGVLDLVRSLPHPAFNLVRGFGVHAPVTEANLDALLETVEDTRPSAWGLPLDPRTRPADLGTRLEERGLREAFRLVALYAPASVARQALESVTRSLPQVTAQ